MTTEELITRSQLRILEAHRERSGQSDMDAGYRLGLLHALNLILKLADDHASDLQRQAELA